ncbi:homeodomain transcription factor ste12 [Borealophlyctis nickersoniae]|nr:homeodomain transcription factor ste12 [Borealophlyctis nickersoniae]
MKRFPLPNGEAISCVLWKNVLYMTGTDIVRSLMFRFHAFGRPVKHVKKFEEGVFSDLRNLKPGVDACLEEPRSDFLEMLYKNNCIRTQKKQKVFYWYSVPHDRLFMDALERDLKREALGVDPTTVAVNPMGHAPTLELAKQQCSNPVLPPMRSRLDPPQHQYGHPQSHVQQHPQQQPQQHLQQHPHSHPHHSSTQPENSLIDDWIHENPLVNNNQHHHPQQQQQQQHQPHYQHGRQQNSQHHSFHNTYNQFLDPNRGHPQQLHMSSPAVSQGSISPYLSNAASPELSGRSSPELSSASDDGYHQNVANPDNDYIQHGSRLPLPPVSSAPNGNNNLYGMFSLFDSSSAYKQRRRGQAIVAHPVPDAIPNRRASTSATSGTSHHEERRNYTCTFPSCSRKFKRYEHLRRHVRCHTGEKPFVCPVEGCGKGFSRSDNLSQHAKVHASPSQSFGESRKNSTGETTGQAGASASTSTSPIEANNNNNNNVNSNNNQHQRGSPTPPTVKYEEPPNRTTNPSSHYEPILPKFEPTYEPILPSLSRDAPLPTVLHPPPTTMHLPHLHPYSTQQVLPHHSMNAGFPDYNNNSNGGGGGYAPPAQQHHHHFQELPSMYVPPTPHHGHHQPQGGHLNATGMNYAF